MDYPEVYITMVSYHYLEGRRRSMILERETISIQELLNPEICFYAHTKTEENLCYDSDETIAEHTGRCLNHFKKIVKEKGIEEILLNFEKKWLSHCNKEELELFRDMFIHTITFHDIGKINPLFQKDKMKNPKFANAKGNEAFGSKHSLISSIFYLEYFLPKSKEFSKDLRGKLRVLTYVNAYIISKHHGNLEEFERYVNRFQEEEIRDKWEVLKTEYRELLNDKAELLNEGYCMKTGKRISKYFPTEPYESMLLYAYEKLLFSLVIASDYYATTEYNQSFVMESHGNIQNMKLIMDIYAKSNVMKSIRSYQKKKYENTSGEQAQSFWNKRDINVLRSELFLEAEENLLKNKEKTMYYLEAPTGSGKSNTALNLSFQLMEQCQKLNKIWYIYPFNTLVEQNIRSLEQIFGEQNEILKQVRIVNSITPMGKPSKVRKDGKDKKEEPEAELKDYVNDLLDRQFFNYPITLSTHVTFFDLLFGNRKELGFGFYQLVNSVVVLDEIQSYRNEIWTEMIAFLKVFAEVLNMKIIIMSATLPDLDLLSRE